jgi:hypothetical protein
VKTAKIGDKAVDLVDRYGTVDDYLKAHLALEFSPVRWAMRSVNRHRDGAPDRLAKGALAHSR